MKGDPPVRAYSAMSLAAVLMIVCGACGFAFSRGPPVGHENLQYFSCTESNAGPILDVIWGGLNVLGALVVASDPDSYADSDETITIGLAWGVLSGASASAGFNKSRQCREARQLLNARHSQAAPSVVQQSLANVQTVVVTPAVDTLSVGQRRQLVATGHSSSGNVLPNRSFTWSSSNDAIASVSNAGLVSAHAEGSVVIAARTGGVVGTARIAVAIER